MAVIGIDRRTRRIEDLTVTQTKTIEMSNTIVSNSRTFTGDQGVGYIDTIIYVCPSESNDRT